MKQLGLYCELGLAALVLLAWEGSVRAEGSEPSRVAVVVGANAAAPGRLPLRYAHNDAREVGRVLRAVGGFTRENVHVLLDPDPPDVLALVDRELASLERTSESMKSTQTSPHRVISQGAA